MTLESYLILAHSDTALLALMCLLCFLRFSKNPIDIKLVGFVSLGSVLANMLTLLLANIRLTQWINIPSSIYDFLFMVLVSMLYDNQTNKKHGAFFKVIPVIYIFFGLANLIFFQKEEIASYTKLGGSLIIISYAAIYFYRLMIDLPTLEVHRLPMFWFNSAFLIFNAGAVFLFAFTSYLIHVLKDDMLIYYSFHNILSILHHLIMIVGLLYFYRSSPSVITT